MKLVSFAFTAALLFLPMQASAQQDLLSPETLEALSQQVTDLQDKLDETTALLDNSRPEIVDLQYIIENSDEVAQQVTDDLQYIIDSLNVGSANHATLEEVTEQIQLKINEYGESDSETLRDVVVPALEERIIQLDQIDQRRDRVVADAMEAQRMLRVNQRELEALILVNATDELIEVYTQMLDSAESTVADARQVGQDLSRAAGLDTQ